MAIFGQIQQDELGTKYTHYGWFGLCPIYLGDIDSTSATLAERNWVPSWWLVFCTELFGAYIFVRTYLDPEWEPMFPIAVGERIKRVDTTKASFDRSADRG